MSISILQFTSPSYQLSDYASDPKVQEAVDSSDNRVQPNPNWAQLPNVPQLNSPPTNMIPSTPMQGGAPQGQGQQSLWPSVGAANFGGGPAMGTNPLSPVDFSGAQNPLMMGPNFLPPGALNVPGAQNPQMMGPNPLTPGALNFPGAQNPHMMGPNPLMPGAFNLPGAQNPQMMGPNPFLKPGAFNFPEVLNPLMPGMHGHLPLAG